MDPRKSTFLYLKEIKQPEFRRVKVWWHHGYKQVSKPNWRRYSLPGEPEPEPTKGQEGEHALYQNANWTSCFFFGAQDLLA